MNEENEHFPKKVEKMNKSCYKDLRDYNWKPGFEEIPSSEESEKKKR